MNKFVSTITKSHEGIREDRAQNKAQKTELKQKALVDKLQGEVLDLEGKIQDLTDLAPEDTTSLKPQDFDEEHWVEKMQQYKIDLLNKQIELETAKETYNDWFVAEETNEEG